MSPAAADGPASIVVVGSANQDYLVSVAAPPAPGQTVLASRLLKQPGGKGANQAVAAARLGGAVRMIAAVGDDADGTGLIHALRSDGVDTSDVEVIAGGTTGLALIWVDELGENSITVVPGTNFALAADRVDEAVRRAAASAPGTIMVTQAEVRPEITVAAVRAAAAADARVVVNLAPFRLLDADLLAVCDPLVINESEASALLGWPVRGAEAARRAVLELQRRARSVVITVGAQGACWADATGTGHVPAPPNVRVVDTTGAGDAFVGALAVRLAGGAPLEDAVVLGVRVGSYAVGGDGAQPSYPSLADLER